MVEGKKRTAKLNDKFTKNQNQLIAQYSFVRVLCNKLVLIPGEHNIAARKMYNIKSIG